jgi:hypothetical protein
LKIGGTSEASKKALAKANDKGMDAIFDLIKSGGVSLKKVNYTHNNSRFIGF